VFHWELDEPAYRELADLPHPARQALADFMDAVVIVDPADYQSRPGEPNRNLRTLPFGPHSQGLVTFLIYPPDDLVLVVKIQWLGS
jgi:hypothetical protein